VRASDLEPHLLMLLASGGVDDSEFTEVAGRRWAEVGRLAKWVCLHVRIERTYKSVSKRSEYARVQT
jgi:hypothetical protein